MAKEMGLFLLLKKKKQKIKNKIKEKKIAKTAPRVERQEVGRDEARSWFLSGG